MTKKLDIIEVAEKALTVIESLLNKTAEGIINVTKEGEEWKVLAEMLERKAVPDTQDILSIYELKLSGDLELTGYKRIGLRRRDDLRVEEEELK